MKEYYDKMDQLYYYIGKSMEGLAVMQNAKTRLIFQTGLSNYSTVPPVKPYKPRKR